MKKEEKLWKKWNIVTFSEPKKMLLNKEGLINSNEFEHYFIGVLKTK